MGSNDQINKLFWLAYCDTLKKKVGELGPEFAIFYASEAQPGPPVGTDAAYTDYGIYNIANNLLTPTNLFYAPASTDTYVGALQAYLSWVDVGGKKDDAHLNAVVQAKASLDSAGIQRDNELSKALDQYNKYKTAGLLNPPDQQFIDWVPKNAKGFTTAIENYNTASGQYRSAVGALGGPLTSKWDDQMQTLQDATDPQAKLQPGVNMTVTSASPPSMKQIYDAQMAGTKIPPPTALYNVPDYGCPDYAKWAVSWGNTATQPPTKAQSATLDLKQAENIDESSFGQTKIDGGASISYGGIFSFGATGSSDHSEETLTTSYTASDVSVTLFWDDLKKVTVTPGIWNVSNPRGDYPNLKPGAPQSVKFLVKPTQLVLINNLGYSIKVSNTVKTEFDKKISDTKTAGGQVKIFGLPISLGADVSTTNKSAYHKGTWDSASGTFTVEPIPQAGFATILAVVGEKVKTF